MRCTRLLLVGGEREVALDHHRLGHRGVGGKAELGGDGAFVHVAAARERRLLAVERERPAGDRRVLERAAHQAGGDDRHAVVGERDRAGVGELAHLRQLVAVLAARDRCEEADGDLASCFAVSTSERSVAAESTTGSVFGIARIAQ